MTLHARKVVQTLLVAAAILAVAAPAASANHSTKTHVSTGPTGGNGAADVFFSFAAADGSKVFFETPESLVAGDTDSAYDLYEREAGATTLVSTGSTGGNGNFDVFPSDVSADGSRVFFETEEQLVAGDTDNFFDIYERSGGTTTLVSTGSTGGNGAFDVFFHDISIDGARVFFETEEKLVAADTDNQADIYERTAGSTLLVSSGSPGNGNFPAIFAGISQDGTRVFFETDEQLLPGDTDSNFDVYRRQSGTTSLLSTGSPTGGNGPFDATFSDSSDDGTRVFFQTDESLIPADSDTSTDVYERTGTVTTLVSAGGNGAFPATHVGNSGSGTRVYFETSEPLVAGDTDTSVDVYERSGGTTTNLVSTGTPGNGPFDASYAGNSSDGNQVWFETRESLQAGDTDSALDVYERSGGSTTRVSTGPGGGNAAIDAIFVGSAPDGSRVIIETTESLVVSDSDTFNDVYERWLGTTTHISTGPTGGNGPLAAFFDGISDTGQRIYFDTRESLLASDTDTSRDVYVADVAGYVRPQAAPTLQAALVPAFEPCTAPDRMHGPPLAFGSCNPPDPTSGQLTVGAPEVNGQVANASGFVKYKVIPGVPGGPDDSDVSIRVVVVDVRQQGTLADYAGQLQATSTVRITDRLNGPSQAESATGEVELPVTVPCTVTGSGSIGSTCSVSTTLDAVTPGAVPEGKRSVWALDRIRVNDGGPDGVAGTTPNTLFMSQGVFVP